MPTDEEDVCIFVGNFSPSGTAADLETSFGKFGTVTKVDLKAGFAFVWLADGAEAAVKELDGSEIAGRPVRVEHAKGNGLIKRRENDRKARGELKPSPTLFVINFDPLKTPEDDLRAWFEEFGTVVRVQMTRNFAFVQFESEENAITAQKEMDGKRLSDGRDLTVEFSLSTRTPRSYGREREGDRYYDRRDYGDEWSRRYDYGRVPERGYARPREYERDYPPREYPGREYAPREYPPREYPPREYPPAREYPVRGYEQDYRRDYPGEYDRSAARGLTARERYEPYARPAPVQLPMRRAYDDYIETRRREQEQQAPAQARYDGAATLRRGY